MLAKRWVRLQCHNAQNFGHKHLPLSETGTVNVAMLRPAAPCDCLRSQCRLSLWRLAFNIALVICRRVVRRRLIELAKVLALDDGLFTSITLNLREAVISMDSTQGRPLLFRSSLSESVCRRFVVDLEPLSFAGKLARVATSFRSET